MWNLKERKGEREGGRKEGRGERRGKERKGLENCQRNMYVEKFKLHFQLQLSILFASILLLPPETLSFAQSPVFRPLPLNIYTTFVF